MNVPKKLTWILGHISKKEEEREGLIRGAKIRDQLALLKEEEGGYSDAFGQLPCERSDIKGLFDSSED